MIDVARLGRLQRRALRYLDHGRTVTTTELAAVLLGRVDTEAV
jgi:hypothetical protein